MTDCLLAWKNASHASEQAKLEYNAMHFGRFADRAPAENTIGLWRWAGIVDMTVLALALLASRETGLWRWLLLWRPPP